MIFLIKKIIWFNKDANLKDIEKQFRRKIVITDKWNSMNKIFNKINKIL